jgi:hypothetical protein
MLRGLGLDAGTAEPDELGTFRGAVAVVIPPDEGAAGTMRGAVLAHRLRGIAAKVSRAKVTAENFADAARAGADVSTWPAVADAAELPEWTPEAAEAAALDAQEDEDRQRAEDRALDLALAEGRELPPDPSSPPPAHPWEQHRATFAEYVNLAPEPTRWLVEGVIEAGALVLVYGAAGSLKSMLFSDLALCVAAGTPWLEPESATDGARPIMAERRPVVWFDLDNGRKRTHRRVHPLATGHGIAEATIAFYSFPPLDLSSPESAVALRDIIVREGAGLAVVDTFINATSIENENDNAQLRGPLFALRQIAEQTGCTIIALHHPNKSTEPGKSHNDIRGGGAIAGAVDLALRVVRLDPSADQLTIAATKVRGAPVMALSALWAYERDANGDLVSGTFYRAELEDPAADALEELKAKAYAELKLRPLNVTKLRAELGCGKPALLTALEQLHAEKRVRFDIRAKGAKVYEAL